MEEAAPPPAAAAAPAAPPPPAWHDYRMLHVRKITKHVEDARYGLSRRKELERSGKKQKAEFKPNDSIYHEFHKSVPHKSGTVRPTGVVAYALKSTATGPTFVEEELRKLRENAAASDSPPPGAQSHRPGAGTSRMNNDSWWNAHVRAVREAIPPTSYNIDQEGHRTNVTPDSYMGQHVANQTNQKKRSAHTDSTPTYRGVKASSSLADTFLMSHVRKVAARDERTVVPREVKL